MIVVPLREPVLLAKQAATLDVFSRGRMIFGVGVGAYREEFEATYPKRKGQNRGGQKQQTDGAILVAGSGTLVGTLLGADLVDELRLMVFPTVLGRGKRLFPDGIDRLKLKLTESRQVGPDGVQVQVYQRAT